MKDPILLNPREDKKFSNEHLWREAASGDTKYPLVNDNNQTSPPEILFITSYPPRECGIATYSQDLIKALNQKFNRSFSIKVCALAFGTETYNYPGEVEYTLDTSRSSAYITLAENINGSPRLQMVLIQHEFGFFDSSREENFLAFLYQIDKPIIIVFHTVLPAPDAHLKKKVISMAAVSASVVVMTHNAAQILMDYYEIPRGKITVIAHGTHLVLHVDKQILKKKYNLSGRKVLSTFGLLSSGKSIETTLNGLPAIIKKNPETLFLIIGKTHPGVIKSEGEKYRDLLTSQVNELHLLNHVKFINHYLSLEELLEYLQLTDIYLFTSKDRNQAVSGTFSYAMSCACPIISTPIPHAREVLKDDAGIIIDFEDSQQLAANVVKLLNDEPMRKTISSNSLQRIVSTAWENSAVAHATLFGEVSGNTIQLQYNLPEIRLDHLKRLTTKEGMVQFSKLNHPDIDSGYTLDDNARALIAVCMHYELTREMEDIPYMNTYLHFIKCCLQPSGEFFNYMDENKKFTKQNEETNLEDANGRAIWALGYLISRKAILPPELASIAQEIIRQALPAAEKMHSTRAMAFVIKGLYYYNKQVNSTAGLKLAETLAERLANMYKHESDILWEWYESYLTYANSILPEAMLYAYLLTRKPLFKDIACVTIDFLLSQTFSENSLKVISNKSWLHKAQTRSAFGEQPIDVAYTILTLSEFYEVFKKEEYLKKIKIAFNWFLGNNHLHQIIYNPCTGGCYDGLEENHVNLNQGAESTVCYLMARLTIEKMSGNEIIPAKYMYNYGQ